jgi:hypothetical protein
MLGRKPRQHRTIADATILKKRLAFTCGACGAITSKEPGGAFYKPKMELATLAQASVCSECGAGNVTGKLKQLRLTLED